MTAKPSAPIQASAKTLTILETLSSVESAGVSEIAAELEMAKGTVHHHLRTLEQFDFVVNEDGTYRLSLRFLDYGERARSRTKLFQIAKPEVEELAEETGEIAYLTVAEHGQGIILYRAAGEQAVHGEISVGLRVPLHRSAPGKAILAVSDGDRSVEAIDETDPNRLARELEAVRRSGYGADNGQLQVGYRSIASPIRIPDEDAIGAVGIVAPEQRLDNSRFGPEAIEATTSASRLIGIKGSYS